MVDVTQFPDFPNYKTAVPGWISALSSPFTNQSERLERTKPKPLPTYQPQYSPSSLIQVISYLGGKEVDSKQQMTAEERIIWG